MKRIYKYPLEAKFGSQHVSMPKHAEIKAIQPQSGNPCMWAFVDPENEVVAREFILVPTGGEPIPAGLMGYLGTFQIGWLVYHVFG